MYTRLRRFKEAVVKELRQGRCPPLEAKPDDKIYLDSMRGALEERQKHYDAAEEQFRKILAIDQNNSMTLIIWATCLLIAESDSTMR